MCEIQNSEVAGMRTGSKEETRTTVRFLDGGLGIRKGKLLKHLGSTPDVEAGRSGLPGQTLDPTPTLHPFAKQNNKTQPTKQITPKQVKQNLGKGACSQYWVIEKITCGPLVIVKTPVMVRGLGEQVKRWGGFIAKNWEA